MNNIISFGNDWQRDFPIDETYLAADGQKISFHISADETPTGFFVKAEETEKSKGSRFGYNFHSFSPISPYLALGKIRDKIRKRLSTKFINYSDHSLTHNELVGVIEYSSDEQEIILQVDGDKISFEDLKEILSTYEGSEIEITIKEQ